MPAPLGLKGLSWSTTTYQRSRPLWTGKLQWVFSEDVLHYFRLWPTELTNKDSRIRRELSAKGGGGAWEFRYFFTKHFLHPGKESFVCGDYDSALEAYNEAILYRWPQMHPHSLLFSFPPDLLPSCYPALLYSCPPTTLPSCPPAPASSSAPPPAARARVWHTAWPEEPPSSSRLKSTCWLSGDFFYHHHKLWTLQFSETCGCRWSMAASRRSWWTACWTITPRSWTSWHGSDQPQYDCLQVTEGRSEIKVATK